MAKTAKRIRRTPEQLIADLEAKIEDVKRRAEQRKVKKDPALRHVSGAVRSIDKALAQTKDAATRAALSESRVALAAILALNGAASKANAGALAPKASAGPKVSPEQVTAYLTEHPGCRAESIAAGLGTDTAGIRPALTRLKARGQVKAKGKARATRYYGQR